jgi:ABC-type enterochelin transport system permease subunit
VVPQGRAAGRPAPPRAPLTQPVRPARGRKARLAIRRIDPWSVFVTSLLLSVFLAVVSMVAAFILYAVLSAAGVPESVNTNIGDVLKQPDLLTRGKFLGIAALISAANVILLTALATLGSLLYNLVATFTGGLELTLAEND